MSQDINSSDNGSSGGAAPPANTRPNWLPEAHWDAQQGAIKPEFGQHFSELSQFKRAADERAATVPATPDGYKVEINLPTHAQVPEDLQLRIDETDPRLGLAREVAKEIGLDQRQFSRLLGLEAQIMMKAHGAEMERISVEDKKLGDNGKARKEAVATWAKGLLDRKEISDDEYQEIRTTAAFAAGVTLLEKLIAKANGAVPGTGSSPPGGPKPSDVPLEQRWYGNRAR